MSRYDGLITIVMACQCLITIWFLRNVGHQSFVPLKRSRVCTTQFNFNIILKIKQNN